MAIWLLLVLWLFKLKFTFTTIILARSASVQKCWCKLYYHIISYMLYYTVWNRSRAVLLEAYGLIFFRCQHDLHAKHLQIPSIFKQFLLLLWSHWAGAHSSCLWRKCGVKASCSYHRTRIERHTTIHTHTQTNKQFTPNSRFDCGRKLEILERNHVKTR